MVIFWVLTVCGGVIRQYGNFYQNYNNFSKIFFSVYGSHCNYSIPWGLHIILSCLYQCDIKISSYIFVIKVRCDDESYCKYYSKIISSQRASEIKEKTPRAQITVKNPLWKSTFQCANWVFLCRAYMPLVFIAKTIYRRDDVTTLYILRSKKEKMKDRDDDEAANQLHIYMWLSFIEPRIKSVSYDLRRLVYV